MTRSHLLRRFVAAIALFAPLCAFAAPGDLDTSFGGTGIVLGPANSFSNEGISIDRREGVIFLQTTESATARTLVLLRLKSNGTADTAFGSGGSSFFASTPLDTFLSTNISLDGRRILVVGTTPTEIRVARYTEAGVPDATFGTAGVVTIAATNVFPIIEAKAQADRKVVIVTGSQDPAAAAGTQQVTTYRLTEAGAPDATFGTAGVVYTTIPGGSGVDRGTGVAIQPDGKIVVTGRSRRVFPDFDAFLLRYQTNGVLDPAFATGGMLVVPFGTERAYGRRLVLAPDGKITVTGTIFDASSAIDRIGTFRVNGDGSLDVGFGSAGSSNVPVPPFGGAVFNIARQSDNKVVSVGFRDTSDADPPESVATVYRFTAFGTLDTSWGGDGQIDIVPPGFTVSNLGSVGVDDRDRILVVGSTRTATDTRWFVARLQAGRLEECR